MSDILTWVVLYTETKERLGHRSKVYRRRLNRERRTPSSRILRSTGPVAVVSSVWSFQFPNIYVFSKGMNVSTINITRAARAERMHGTSVQEVILDGDWPNYPTHNN